MNGSFSALVLVAEPRFLGILRGQLDAATEHIITRTVNKGLEPFDGEDLQGRLRELVRAPLFT